MDPLSLFIVALGLSAPWEVVDVVCDPKSGRIDFHRAFAPGTRFSCSHCEAEHQPVHDTLERDGRLPGVSDGRVWRTLDHYVDQAHAQEDFSTVISVSLDETASRRGHTLHELVSRSRCSAWALCLAKGEKPRLWPNLPMRSRLLASVPRTSARSVWICRQATRLACVSIGPGRRSPAMSFTSFSSSTRRLTKCAAKKSKGPRSCGVHATSGSRTSTLGVTARKPRLRNSSAETSRHTVASGSRRRYVRSSTALRARRKPGCSSTDGTVGRAVTAWSRSTRWPRRFKKHWPGLLNAFDSKLINGRVEAVNSLIQAAKARARGYGTTRHLIPILYLVAGKLTQLPTSPFVVQSGLPVTT